MSGDDATSPPDMPDDIVDLLAGARGVEGPSPKVRDRMRARLRADLLPPGSDGGGGESGGAPKTAPQVRPWARAPWWGVAAAFVAGIGAGRLTSPSRPEIAIAPPPPAVVVSAVSAPSPPPVPLEGPAPIAVSELPAAKANEHPAVPASAASASAKSTGDLAAERRLLGVARSALGRGNGVDALAACDEHTRRFPDGLLAEEREAIAVQALASSNRLAEAKERAQRFKQRYPKSILLPAVLARVEGEP